ncbi:von Willebrand factor A domain-containing protein 7-like [Eucyclogobius newberryi]|uniref:von Willebrand factor A domain-containing protein 7-like n=1 Tax=Eucyclogobius newberryi TaxID=166745 RepID=UPI003B59A69A
MMSGLFLFSLLLVTTGVTGFQLDQDRDSQSHGEITEKAILDVTAQACRALAREERRPFILPATLTVESLLEACAAKSSAGDFARNKFQIKGCNSRVNIDYPDAQNHFDNEHFEEGKRIITDGLFTVKTSIDRKNYDAARCKLGEILHILQDFYSHSNWIEMGNDQPNTNLIKRGGSLGETAEDKPTCRNCTEDCTDNILDDILTNKLLTSGYFSPNASNTKPKGKCSHGDGKDSTRHSDATGGINKDRANSSHGHLHIKAAQVATAASSELLDDVLAAVGHKNFSRMMGLNPGKALCFVVDTTQSMGFDIESIDYVVGTLIANVEGTAKEPSVYILVPFNDPAFGPVFNTTKQSEFKKAIKALVASGGGDEPEMSLSGLQLALHAVPTGSDIYVFTDARAKDAHLKNSVITLIQRTQCVVNFIISKVTLNEPIYADLANVSGGLIVKVTKDTVLKAIPVFLQSFFDSLVTILQADRRNPGKQEEDFPFFVDETETNPIVFITGAKDFTLISPKGTVQTTTTGSLTMSENTVGNLLVLNLKTEVGQWKITVRSTGAYTLKIVVQSFVGFFYSFMTPSKVRSDGYAVSASKPIAGRSATMMVVLFGSDTIDLKEVDLVYSSGSGQLRGNITGQEDNEYLVQFDKMPSEEFTVQVKTSQKSVSGLIRSTSGTFQRQSTANQKASFISVDLVRLNSTNSSFNTKMTVSASQGTAGEKFTIRATISSNVGRVTFPSTIELSGGSANAVIQTTLFNTTQSGTEVTLTVEAEAPSGLDLNYDVQRFSFINEVTDNDAPVFEKLTPEPNCSDVCSSTWQLSIRATDDTAIQTIYAREGNGTLVINPNPTSKNETTASYSASCCSPAVTIVAVDEVGNVGKFQFNVSEAKSVTTTAQPTTKPTSANSTPLTSSHASSTSPPPASTSTTSPAPVLFSCLTAFISQTLLCALALLL